MKAPVLDKNPSILTGEKAVCVDTNAGRSVDLAAGRWAIFLLNAPIFSMKYKVISSAKSTMEGVEEIWREKSRCEALNSEW